VTAELFPLRALERDNPIVDGKHRDDLSFTSLGFSMLFSLNMYLYTELYPSFIFNIYSPIYIERWDLLYISFNEGQLSTDKN
jgi:hypothetical protein